MDEPAQESLFPEVKDPRLYPQEVHTDGIIDPLPHQVDFWQLLKLTTGLESFAELADHVDALNTVLYETGLTRHESQRIDAAIATARQEWIGYHRRKEWLESQGEGNLTADPQDLIVTDRQILAELLAAVAEIRTAVWRDPLGSKRGHPLCDDRLAEALDRVTVHADAIGERVNDLYEQRGEQACIDMGLIVPDTEES